jgi:hypothetical protein
MRKFLRNLVFLVLLLAVGFLAWQHAQQQKTITLLQQTVIQLRSELRQHDVPVTRVEPQGGANNQTDIRPRIEAETSALRGLRFKQPVTYKTMPRAELRQFLMGKVREQYTERELHDYARSLAALGLIPEGTDLLSALVGMYDEQVAAFYDPDEHALYTFNDLSWSSGVDKMLLSHELTHVLQDQNFNLSSFPLKEKHNDDLVLATASLVEGDATVLMTRWYAENVEPGAMLGDLAKLFSQNTDKLRDAPAYLREMLLFPYVQGQQFVLSVFNAGGIKALNEAFQHPPVSSKEILHPEKFLHDRSPPTKIELKTASRDGWRLIGDNVVGEFGVHSLLQQHLGLFESQHIAGGWQADRYHVYEHGSAGATILVWRSLWETEDAAAQFRDVYQQVVQRRELTAEVKRAGKTVTIRQSGDKSAPISEIEVEE